MKLNVSLLSATAALFGTSSLFASADTITEIVVADDRFDTLEVAVGLAGLADTLADTLGDDVTVLAPTDDAFDALPDGLLAQLTSDPYLPHLTDVLLYHVLAGETMSTSITNGLMAETLNGEKVTFTVDTSGDATVITVDAGGAEVIQADVDAENGIVHVIDAVLTPSWVGKSIVDVAVAAGSFGELVALASLFDDIVAALTGPGPLTLFAPPDAIFNAIKDQSPDIFAGLAANPDVLKEILLAHVIPGVVTAGRIPDGETMVEALSGEMLKVKKMDGMVTVNGIMVTSTDILATNGVIHVLDGLIVPADINLMDVIVDIDLTDYGGTPAEEFLPLGVCEGDCDSNDDCADGLVCFQRNRGDPIPGCKGPLGSRSDFCMRMGDDKGVLEDFGGTPPSDKFPLKLCQGDCDNNLDCEGSLICYQRGPNDPVPGCVGTSGARTDFCVYPRNV